MMKSVLKMMNFALKGEAAVKPLGELDSRPSIRGQGEWGEGGADSPGMDAMLRPTPPDSRPPSMGSGSGRPVSHSSSQASTMMTQSVNDEPDVPQEDGWQIEFEIRESALYKLQEQMLEEQPPPPREDLQMTRVEDADGHATIQWVYKPPEPPATPDADLAAEEVGDAEPEPEPEPIPEPPKHIKMGGKLGKVEEDEGGLDDTFEHPFGHVHKRGVDAETGEPTEEILEDREGRTGGPESTAGVAVLVRYLPAEPKEEEADWGEEDPFDNEQVAYREGILGPLCKAEGGQLEMWRIELADRDVKAERKIVNTWAKKNKKDLEGGEKKLVAE